jgi:hypothetical protein
MLALVAVLVGLESRAGAVPFVVKNLDPPGQGFNDPKVVAPVGGNPGTTVGQQRLNVFQRAAQMWGAALGGTVPIEIDASFAPLPCMGGFVVLGNARPGTFVIATPGAPMGKWVPVALANQMAGGDQAPLEAEIEATFNGGLSDCTMGRQDWYYGFDGQAGDDTDLLGVVLHELGHGLGFTSTADETTGAVHAGFFDLFTQNVFDSTAGKAWTAMSDLERAASVQNVRGLSWQGPSVTRQVAELLAVGRPTLRITPALAGLGGHLSEAEFGPALAGTVSGPLRVGTITPGSCAFVGTAPGAVVLITETSCAPIQKAHNAQQAGAVAVLLAEDDLDPPLTIDVAPSHRALFPFTVPVLALSRRDGQALAAAPAGTTVQLTSEASARLGADGAGRALLFATRPVDQGSTLSHWDVLARPNLVMEPFLAPEAAHDLRMELALFRDMGWTTTCGNGSVEPGEACDQGAQNGAAGSGCRSDCTLGGPGGMDAGPVIDRPDAAGLPPDSGAGGMGGARLDAAAGSGGAGAGGSGGGLDAGFGAGGTGGVRLDASAAGAVDGAFASGDAAAGPRLDGAVVGAQSAIDAGDADDAAVRVRPRAKDLVANGCAYPRGAPAEGGAAALAVLAGALALGIARRRRSGRPSDR